MRQNLDQVTALASEYVEIAGMGIALQRFLDLQCQAVHAAPHVGMAGGKPHPHPGGDRDHRRDKRRDDGRCQRGRRRGRNAQTGHPAKLDLDRQPSTGCYALPRGRGQHNLGKTSHSLTQFLAPAIKLPGINICPGRHLGNHRARGKRRCHQRALSILTPTIYLIPR
jgi:hypothetical protein